MLVHRRELRGDVLPRRRAPRGGRLGLELFERHPGTVARPARAYTERVSWDVLSDEQREIRELVRTLARERIAPRAAEIDESHEFPWDVVEVFRENDVFGVLFD